VGAVIGVNLLSLTDWYLRMANFAALVVLLVVGAYVFFVLSAMDLPGLRRPLITAQVLSAMDLPGLRRPLITALLLSIGSLHWTILGATAVGISYGVMYHFAIALLPLLGVVLPALVVTLILRPVFTGLAAPVPVPSRPPEPATP